MLIPLIADATVVVPPATIPGAPPIQIGDPKQPDVWVEFVTSTTTYRWSTRAFADAGSYEGGFKEGRIAQWATITRALSDPQGQHEAAKFGWTIRDTDRFVRGLLGGVATEELVNLEAAIKLVSTAGRRAETTPRIVARGRVREVSLEPGLLAQFSGHDVIAADFGALSGSKLIPQRMITRELFPDVHRDLIGYPQPIIYGEISDELAVDAAAVSSAKGLCPVFWVGTEAINGVTWDRYLVAGHAVKDIHEWFGSDLATPETRVKQTAAGLGTDFLIPGQPGWPFATPYRDLMDTNGDTHRVTLIYAKGDVSDSHKQGHVNITVNVCGIEHIGDGSGTLIVRAFRVYQHCLANWVLANGGKGYYTGLWPALTTWSLAGPEVTQLHTDSFKEAEEVTYVRMGNGVGYQSDFALTQSIPLRELIKRFNTSFDVRLGVNAHAQLFLAIIDDGADVSADTLYRDRIDLVSMPPPTFEPDEIENRVIFVYDWDADKQKFRGDKEIVEDVLVQAAHGSVRESALQEYFCVRHPPTARDVAARRLLRLKRTPRYQSIVVNLAGLEIDLGTRFRITHYDGIGDDGYVEHPFFCVRHELDLNRMQVTLTGLDLSRIVAWSAPPLEDENDELFNFLLGDETSNAAPPVGAFELV